MREGDREGGRERGRQRKEERKKEDKVTLCSLASSSGSKAFFLIGEQLPTLGFCVLGGQSLSMVFLTQHRLPPLGKAARMTNQPGFPGLRDYPQ